MNERSIRLHQANILGTIHSPGGFAASRGAALDAVEVRVDMLPESLTREELLAVELPILLTIRREDEGGGRALSDGARVALYGQFLEAASAIDVEARSIPALADVVRLAKEKSIPVVLSYHDFVSTPSVALLRDWVAQAREAGADIVKIAAVTEKPTDVARLLEILERAEGPISVMGMGTLGRASRLLFAKAGSVLNYGWLDRPQVPGQWSAEEFAALVARA